MKKRLIIPTLAALTLATAPVQAQEYTPLESPVVQEVVSSSPSLADSEILRYLDFTGTVARNHRTYHERFQVRGPTGQRRHGGDASIEARAVFNAYLPGTPLELLRGEATSGGELTLRLFTHPAEPTPQEVVLMDGFRESPEGVICAVLGTDSAEVYEFRAPFGGLRAASQVDAYGTTVSRSIDDPNVRLEAAACITVADMLMHNYTRR